MRQSGRHLRHSSVALLVECKHAPYNPVTQLDEIVPEFGALYGLTVLYPEAEWFPPLRRRWLVERSKDYEERGPAIEWLCEWLRKPRRSVQP